MFAVATTIDADNPQRYGMVDTGSGPRSWGPKVIQQPTPLDSGTPIAMFSDPEGHRVGLIAGS